MECRDWMMKVTNISITYMDIALNKINLILIKQWALMYLVGKQGGFINILQHRTNSIKQQQIYRNYAFSQTKLLILYKINRMFNIKSHNFSHISIDCIKACPFQKNLFAFAYYQTNPTEMGAIAVSSINQPADIQKIIPIQTPPLLHLLWVKPLSDNNNYIIAAAERKDSILIYYYNIKSKLLVLKKKIEIGKQVFCLYLDMTTYEDCYQLLVSSNESTVTDMILDEQFDIRSKKIYSKHQYAVWTCRINPFQRNSFVCGDQVNSIYLYSQDQLVARNNKAHKQGICDLTFGNNYTLYSGGFDGIVCAFDVRKFNEVVYRHQWGGTIWRVLPDTSNQRILLCNSSQKKFQIVDSTLSKQLWNSGQAHQSLAYAADWGQDSLVTASFYDKRLCFWDNEGQN